MMDRHPNGYSGRDGAKSDACNAQRATVALPQATAGERSQLDSFLDYYGQPRYIIRHVGAHVDKLEVSNRAATPPVAPDVSFCSYGEALDYQTTQAKLGNYTVRFEALGAAAPGFEFITQ